MEPGGPIDLRAERLNRGLSQDAIAAEIGISRRVWARAEDGGTVWPDNARLIADYLGCKVTDIWPVGEEVPA